MKNKLFGVIIILIIVTCCAINFVTSEINLDDIDIAQASFDPYFFYTENSDIIDARTGTPFTITGINIDNNCWDKTVTPGDRCMDDETYEEIALMGFNTIRFNFAYSMYESKDFYSWLDKHMMLANDAGLKVILCMHAPKGGIQQRDKAAAYDFWNNTSTQSDFISMWVDIANHYRNYSNIIMYDLLNEPLVLVDSNKNPVDVYTNFMNALCDEIRTVDSNHILCIESFNPYTCDKNYNLSKSFSYNTADFINSINDPNIVFDMHNYSYMKYTFQEESALVDYNNIEIIKEETYLAHSPEEHVMVDVYDKWTHYEGSLFQVTSAKLNAGCLQINVKDQTAEMTTQIDNIILEEYDENMNYLGIAYQESFEDTVSYSNKSSGSYMTINDSSDSIGNSLLFQTSGINGELYYIQSKKLFRLTENHFYRIVCDVKTNHKMEYRHLRVCIREYNAKFVGDLDDYIDYTFEKYRNLNDSIGVPIIMNEYGTNHVTVDYSNGERFILNSFSAINANKINVSWFAYTGKDFGLMYDSNRNFGTDKCLLRQDSYDIVYKALHPDSDYKHVFKSDTYLINDTSLKANDVVLVFGLENSAINKPTEYVITSEKSSKSIKLKNGLYARALVDSSNDFQYNTSLIIEGQYLDPNKIYTYFENNFEGDSLTIEGNSTEVEVHFHTNEPWKVLEYCYSLGEIYDIVIENIDRQTRGLQG